MRDAGRRNMLMAVDILEVGEHERGVDGQAAREGVRRGEAEPPLRVSPYA
jgi:hypothetical protein